MLIALRDATENSVHILSGKVQASTTIFFQTQGCEANQNVLIVGYYAFCYTRVLVSQVINGCSPTMNDFTVVRHGNK